MTSGFALLLNVFDPQPAWAAPRVHITLGSCPQNLGGIS
jgi:hypothetical protein